MRPLNPFLPVTVAALGGMLGFLLHPAFFIAAFFGMAVYGVQLIGWLIRG